jgi:hypothetical protein
MTTVRPVAPRTATFMTVPPRWGFPSSVGCPESVRHSTLVRRRDSTCRPARGSCLCRHCRSTAGDRKCQHAAVDPHPAARPRAGPRDAGAVRGVAGVSPAGLGGRGHRGGQPCLAAGRAAAAARLTRTAAVRPEFRRRHPGADGRPPGRRWVRASAITVEAGATKRCAGAPRRRGPSRCRRGS